MPVITSTTVKKENICARCDTHIKEILDILSQAEDRSMSEIVSKSIIEYHERHFPNKSLFEKEKDLFGRYGSRKGDLSIKRKQYFGGTLRAKFGHN